ncbi:MAG: galactose oxidase-like domain-containing protein, partial [Candidatus Eisenbacteria bacterium]
VNPGVPTNAFGQTRLTDLFDPATNSWRRCADMSWFREYHAVSILVPDGRVVTTAGTGGPASPGVSNDIEAFEPPYLFRGLRPRIASRWPLDLRSGTTFSFSVTRTDQVTGVVLVGANAATHWVDGGVPRAVALTFQQAGSKVTASIPGDRNRVPVGHYLLFAVVDDIPSNGLMARVIDDTVVGVPSRPGERLAARLFPNPARGGFEVDWFQSRPGPVAISLLDASGRRVGSWRTGESLAGWRSWRWNAGDTELMPAGIYWIRLSAGDEEWTTRAVLLP